MNRYKLVTLLLISTLVTACASMIVVPQEQRSYEAIHEVALSQKELFAGSMEWLAESFKDSKSVIEYSDQETGKIIGNGRTSFNNMGLSEIPVSFSIRIDTKEGKYRVRYDNFIAYWGEYRNQPQALQYQANVEDVMRDIEALDQSLLSYLSSYQENEDW